MSCKVDDRSLACSPEHDVLQLTVKPPPKTTSSSLTSNQTQTKTQTQSPELTPPPSSSVRPLHDPASGAVARRKPKRERTSSSYIGGKWEPDADEIRALTLADFEVIGVLGVGTYGVVKLARHTRSGASVALKVLSKEHVVAMRQEKHILRERSVHLPLRHAFIARLFGTFQDQDCLFLVIEYLPGGELWSLVYSTEPPVSSSSSFDEQQPEIDSMECNPSLVRSPGGSMPSSPVALALDARSRGLLRNPFGGLQQEHAAFYLGCILSALEYLHNEDLLYRDLKLENLVLDRKGYPKVLDFGFAKPNAANSTRNRTLCGSMDYMAPEIVLHHPHDQRADIWSFGIIMYELLLGKTPFFHENPRELGRRITTEDVSFSPAFEDEYPLACDLIRKLLVRSPDDRLRSMGEVRRHAFFLDVFPDEASWGALLRKQLAAPFVPKLSGPFDTSFFQTVDELEQEELEDAMTQPYFEDGSNIFHEF